MSSVTVDNAMSLKLNECRVPVILFDPSGRKLGRFVPEPTTWDEARVIDGCPYSVEELEAMRKETGGRPLAEIWKELEQK